MGLPTGKPYDKKWAWINDPVPAPASIFERHYAHFTASLKEHHITPPASATRSARSFRRYMAYVLKRAASNHPHNARFKPMHGVYLALMVAEKLEK